MADPDAPRRGAMTATLVVCGLIGATSVLRPQAYQPVVDGTSSPVARASPAALAPPVTVTDIIGMTTIGSRQRGYGDEDYNVVSPDGARVAAVVKRGNLQRNTVDYALLLFRTAELSRSPKPDTVLQLASSSNRPAIVHVRWLSDNATLTFLGEQPGELPQVYTLDTRTRELTAHTHAATVITAFDVAAAGEPIVYAAATPIDTAGYAAMRQHGFVVGHRQLVGDLVAGDWSDQAPSWEARTPQALTVVRAGRVTTVPLPDSMAGYQRCSLRSLMVAPSGDVALMQCDPRAVPAAWTGYRQQEFRQELGLGYTYPIYLVINLTAGGVRPLLNAPVDFGTTLVWAPDGRSVVLANAMLPLDVRDSTERSARATRAMLAEVNVRTGAVTVIARRDSLVALGWDAQTNTVALAPGQYSLSPSETARVYYQKRSAGWAFVSLREMPAAAAVPALVIEQGLNTPPRLVAVEAKTHTHHLVYDPNPALLAAHRFGREDVLHWRTKAGAARVGGLYWPPDYVPGKRYPLVIQTHGFDSTQFWPDGVFSTGSAAQPLAGQGVIVLQMPGPPGDQWATSSEGPLAEEAIEGVIDHLDSLGLIDRTKVGLEGFSRTCYYTLYFLTHSSYPIKAAMVTDGVDFSYLSHLVLFGPLGSEPGRVVEGDKINGGSPFGVGLATWRERAPGFNLDRVTAPLHLTALQPSSLLEEWEPYVGLLLQGKPAELVYIPDGEHILTKPWERLTSQQGAVDWYRFWLKGEEDADPAKAAQYVRWHVLRATQNSSAAKTVRP